MIDFDQHLDSPEPRTPAERLWTVTKDGARRYAELRSNRDFGIEFQLFASESRFLYGQRFPTKAEAMLQSCQERDRRLRDGWTLMETADGSSEHRDS